MEIDDAEHSRHGHAQQGDMTYDKRFGYDPASVAAAGKQGDQGKAAAYIAAFQNYGANDSRTKAAAKDAMKSGWGVDALGHALYEAEVEAGNAHSTNPHIDRGRRRGSRDGAGRRSGGGGGTNGTGGTMKGSPPGVNW